jgi:hypothetical protein
VNSFGLIIELLRTIDGVADPLAPSDRASRRRLETDAGTATDDDETLSTYRVLASLVRRSASAPHLLSFEESFAVPTFFRVDSI